MDTQSTTRAAANSALHGRGIDGRCTLGAAGEDRTAAWYEAQGYEVLASNVRTPFGEIDILAQQAGRLHVIEVKTRSHDAFGGAEAVNARKLKKLRKSAAWWLQQPGQRGRFERVCFDVVEIVGPSMTLWQEVEHGAS
ncbi:YraN family protein [Corynebacterium gerontici]|uniref:UPF0102 protein CGERO_06940 n=1 Tax=Corynebacterium gerontici TaxID=2079234 RepID=A0A3G6J400_9CORY|nr:YraN family protein [Corynebacterium gerontici]AZA11688.1 hypothetical protein CGERO_06940 [Corynebacterium gerontici]